MDKTLSKIAAALVLVAVSANAYGGVAQFSWQPGPGTHMPGHDFEMLLFATGDSEVDAMALYLEIEAPLEFIDLTAIGPGMYFAPSNDGGDVFWAGPQIIGFTVFNPSRTVHLAPLTSAPTLIASATVRMPTGTPAQPYSISTVVRSLGSDCVSILAFQFELLQTTQATAFVCPEPASALLGCLGLLAFRLGRSRPRTRVR